MKPCEASLPRAVDVPRTEPPARAINGGAAQVLALWLPKCTSFGTTRQAEDPTVYLRVAHRIADFAEGSGQIEQMVEAALGANLAFESRSTSDTSGIAELLQKVTEWERQLDDGEVASQAEAARRDGVTRARMTQILALLRLAPERRERDFGWAESERRTTVTEHLPRPIARIADTAEQGAAFPILNGPPIQKEIG